MRFVLFASACVLVASTNPCRSVDFEDLELKPSLDRTFNDYDNVISNFAIGKNGFAWRFLNGGTFAEPAIMCFKFPDGFVPGLITPTELHNAVDLVYGKFRIDHTASALLAESSRSGYEGEEEVMAQHGSDLNLDFDCQRDGKFIGESHYAIHLGKKPCKALGFISNKIFEALKQTEHVRQARAHQAHLRASEPPAGEHHCTHLGAPIPLSTNGEVELYVKGFELPVRRDVRNPDYICFDLSSKSLAYRECDKSDLVTLDPCEVARLRIIEVLHNVLRTPEKNLLGGDMEAVDDPSIHAGTVQRWNHSYHTWDCMDGQNMIFVQIVFHGHVLEQEKVVQHCKQLKHVFDAFESPTGGR